MSCCSFNEAGISEFAAIYKYNQYVAIMAIHHFDLTTKKPLHSRYKGFTLTIQSKLVHVIMQEGIVVPDLYFSFAIR